MDSTGSESCLAVGSPEHGTQPLVPYNTDHFLTRLTTYKLLKTGPCSTDITSRCRQNILKAKLQTMHEHVHIISARASTISPHTTPSDAKTELTVAQTAQKINSPTLVLRVAVL